MSKGVKKYLEILKMSLLEAVTGVNRLECLLERNRLRDLECENYLDKMVIRFI
jgi:hypothetical protein